MLEYTIIFIGLVLAIFMWLVYKKIDLMEKLWNR